MLPRVRTYFLSGYCSKLQHLQKKAIGLHLISDMSIITRRPCTCGQLVKDMDMGDECLDHSFTSSVEWDIDGTPNSVVDIMAYSSSEEEDSESEHFDDAASGLMNQHITCQSPIQHKAPLPLNEWICPKCNVLTQTRCAGCHSRMCTKCTSSFDPEIPVCHSCYVQPAVHSCPCFANMCAIQ